MYNHACINQGRSLGVCQRGEDLSGGPRAWYIEPSFPLVFKKANHQTAWSSLSGLREMETVDVGSVLSQLRKHGHFILKLQAVSNRWMKEVTAF